MIKYGKIFILITVVFLMKFEPVLAADATIKLTSNPAYLEVGDYVDVELRFEAGESMGSLTAGFEYDQSLLAYQSGSGNAISVDSGRGIISDFNLGGFDDAVYTITFKAQKSGTANFRVTDSELIGLETGELLGNPKAGINMEINKISEEVMEENPQEEVTVEDPIPVEEYIPVEIDGKAFYIRREIDESTMPENFRKIDYLYKGEDIQAAENPGSDLHLLYLMDDGLGFEYYIYDDVADVFSAFHPVKAGGEYYLLPMDIELIEFENVTLTIGQSQIQALKYPNSEGFYLLKAYNSKWEENYYSYDEKEGTLQRISLNYIESTSETQNIAPVDKGVKIIFIIMGSIFMVLLISVLFLKLRK
ncbi:hypothetical protein [Alkalibacter mobilis]|uniref:hypothetical protein n=1 Tax=Alkalibacter mobilis TaxID=2787712 RepID=UPI00189FC718|nr:hypothetical protein [Alkalibacter mobilis]MBF7096370.1 hypothetical protein [Alkalibacter mobilis]